jgi:Rieske Fe-S protein
LASGLAVFLDPLLRRRPGKSAPVLVTRLDALPADGTPQAFPVVTDFQDAWTHHAAQPVGAVYLRRTKEGGVEAFNAACPHAGCFVDLREGQFRCPCHNSSFTFDGRRVQLPPPAPPCPSPRDLDPLEVDAQKLAAGEIWVTFQNFRKGMAERVAEA